MPQHHTTADQVVFVGEWFSSWSELQRSDFLPSLLRELHPAHHINGGLPEHLSALSLGSNRPPSIFHCQVKLFHDWVSGWSSEERAKLVVLLRDADPSFGEKIDKAVAALDGGQQRPLEQQHQSLGERNGDQHQQHLEQLQQQVAPPLQVLAPPVQVAAAAPQQQQQQQQLELDQVQDPQPDAAAAVPALAVAAAVDGAAGALESDVDEALDSSPSSTLSSPRPEQNPDSGLDSPVGGEAAEVEAEEDEGGHVVVMDEAVAVVLPADGAAAVARCGEGESRGEGME